MINEYLKSHLNKGHFCNYFLGQLRENPNPHILNEIAYLEGLNSNTETEEEDQFRAGKLRGIWKKHYADYSVKNIAINIENIYKLKKEKSRKFQQNALSIGKNLDENDIYFFSKALAEDTFAQLEIQRKRGKLTGEWIIYFKDDTKLIYLTLANHDESTESIYKRIKENCFPQYPIVREFLGQHC